MLAKKVFREGRFFHRKREKYFAVHPKITGKMKVVSYGSVLTSVIEQMEASCEAEHSKSWKTD